MKIFDFLMASCHKRQQAFINLSLEGKRVHFYASGTTLTLFNVYLNSVAFFNTTSIAIKKLKTIWYSRNTDPLLHAGHCSRI
jgi:hypothetical protein